MKTMTRSQIEQADTQYGADQAFHIFEQCGFLVKDEELYIRSINTPDTALIIPAPGELDGCGVEVFEVMAERGFPDGTPEEIVLIGQQRLLARDQKEAMFENAMRDAATQLSALLPVGVAYLYRDMIDGQPTVVFSFVSDVGVDQLNEVMAEKGPQLNQLCQELVAPFMPGQLREFVFGILENLDTGEEITAMAVVSSPPQPDLGSLLAALFSQGRDSSLLN